MNRKKDESGEIVVSDAESPERGGRIQWFHDDIQALVKLVSKNWPLFREGSRRKRYIWKDIAAELSHDNLKVTGEDCDRKWRNLKIRYLTLREKQLSGEKIAYRVDYFGAIHEFLKDDSSIKSYLQQRHLNTKQRSDENVNYSDVLAEDTIAWTDKSTTLLLNILLEFKDWFSDEKADRNDKAIWQAVSDQMKIEGHYPEPDQCHSKWKALVADYLHHKSEAETTGTVPLWPFYTRVRSILDTITGPLTDTDTGIHNASKRRKKRTLGNIRKKRSVVIKQEVDRIDDDLSIGSNCNNAGVSSSNLGNITITDVDGSTGATQDQGHSPSRNEIREIHRRLTELEERIQICNRLDNLEAKLDSAQQHLEIQSETNTLLGRVLSELSRLGSGLNLRFDQGMRQESTDLGAGITIVVPNSSI